MWCVCVHEHVFCCSPLVQICVCNRGCLYVRVYVSMSDVVDRAVCVFVHMCVAGPPALGVVSPGHSAHTCAHVKVSVDL